MRLVDTSKAGALFSNFRHSHEVSEDVVRVARAICRVHGGDPDFVSKAKRGTDSMTGMEYVVPAMPQWRRYEIDAIAAIKAMQSGATE